MQKNYLAIDIGASSGRHIVGWMENGVLRTEEVTVFLIASNRWTVIWNGTSTACLLT